VHTAPQCPQVKSYLAGNPPIKIKLNDDLLITRRDGSGYNGGGGYGGGSGFSAGDYASDSSLVILDDVNFHEVRAAVSQHTQLPA
jgi:AP-4 complex subunit mu-1